MYGPMPSLASGRSCCTAWAMTWAVEWRRTSRPSGESMVTRLDRGVLGQRLVQVLQLAVDAGDNDVAALKKQFRAGSPGSHLGLFAIDEKGDLLGI